MKVLFLDVDGVLNSLAWCAKQPAMKRAEDMLDPQAVKRVIRVCEATGAVIVLSSSWRHAPNLVAKLREVGLPIIDVTPSLSDNPRWIEISAWLSRHKGEKVERYAIIDDDADADITDHFVRTYPKYGMYGKHEKQLMEILK